MVGFEPYRNLIIRSTWNNMNFLIVLYYSSYYMKKYLFLEIFLHPYAFLIYISIQMFVVFTSLFLPLNYKLFLFIWRSFIIFFIIAFISVFISVFFSREWRWMLLYDINDDIFYKFFINIDHPVSWVEMEERYPNSFGAFENFLQRRQRTMKLIYVTPYVVEHHLVWSKFKLERKSWKIRSTNAD